MSNQVTTFTPPKVALMQPLFMPWLGYFSLILDADVFVFLDDFQFVRRSYHQRNRLFLNGRAEGWVTLPVSHNGKQKIALNSCAPINDLKWQDTFCKTIIHNYKKCEFFDHFYEKVELWARHSYPSLSDMNMALIQDLCKIMGIETQFQLSSTYNIKSSRSEAMANLLEKTGAKTYLCASGSYDYMNKDGLFPLDFCEVYFQNFVPQAYPQRQTNTFVPFLSILDCLMQIGIEQTKEQIYKGSQAYKSLSKKHSEGT